MNDLLTSESVMVSVIVLTYNHERYISHALDSILMQKVGFPFEILVGDDASTDRTPQILKSYQTKFPNIIKLYLRQENVGPTRNAYELFLEAKGRYLATCEGDDYWTVSDKLSRQVGFLEENPQYIGCSHPSVVVDGNETVSKRQRIQWVCRKRVMTLKNFKGYYLPGQASSLVRRNIYRDETKIDFSFFYKANPFIGDRTTALIYLSLGNFYRMDMVMSAYRRDSSGKNMTAQVYQNNKSRIRHDFDYTKKLMRFSREELKVDGGFQYYLRDIFTGALVHYLKNPEWESRQLLIEIMKASDSRAKLILYIPVSIIKKLYNRLTAV